MSIEKINNLISFSDDGYLSTQDIYDMFIEFLVYNRDNLLINENIINVIDIINDSLFIYDTKVVLNPGIHLRNIGYTNGIYKLKYNFYKKILGDFSNENSFLTIKRISPSRTEVEIALPNYIDIHEDVQTDIPINSNAATKSYDINFSNINQFINSDNSKLSYYLFFGNDRSNLIINKLIYNGNLLLKLYEEIPVDISELDKCYIVKKLINSYEDSVNIKTEFKEDLSGLNILSGPKINYKSAGITYRTTELLNLESLIGSDYNTTNEVYRLYLSSSAIEGIDINIDYRNFSNFVHFSSAKKRIENFRYKISKLEYLNSKLSLYNNVSTSSYSSSISTIQNFNNEIRSIINSFDGFEKFMYYNSGSYESSSLGIFPDYTWPKYNNIPPYKLYSVSSSQAIEWYDSMIYSASIYDNLNPDILTNTIPLDIYNEKENENYVKFVQMISHILDINYNYINKMTSIHERQHSIYEGIPRDLILHVVNNYGFDLRSGHVIKGLTECVPIKILSGST